MQKNTQSSGAPSSYNKEENCSGSFTCPTFKIAQQLTIEVKRMNQKLEAANPKQTARLDNSDLKREFHISAGCAADWRNAGLPYIKVAKKIYYERAEVEAFLQRHKHRQF